MSAAEQRGDAASGAVSPDDEPGRTAQAAAARAGVAIRALVHRDDLVAAGGLLDRVWGVDPDGPGGSELQPHLLRALEHSGNYLHGAALRPAASTGTGDPPSGPAAGTGDPPSNRTVADRDAPAPASDGPLVGASIAFLGRVGARWSLHSHITGVLGEQASRGVGAALKWHQRAWCLQRGITLVTWTFDPLIARNAWFNLGRLGARPVEYLVDFYGPMADGRNAGQPTDRLGVQWDLQAPSTAAAAAAIRAAAPVRAVVGNLLDPPQRWLQVGPDGGPDSPFLRTDRADDQAVTLPAPRSDEDDAVVAIPDDAERLWVTEPAVAARWRRALRRVLGAAMADPRWELTAFRPRVGYVFTPVTASDPSLRTPPG